MVEESVVDPVRGFWTPGRRRDGLVVLLTVVTGSVDAIGLLRLGGVFTSVMTGNMVFLGMAAAKHDGSIAAHTGVAFLAYVVGSFLGARVAGHSDSEDHMWPRPVVSALVVELVLLAGVTAWWEFVRGAPDTSVAYGLLAANACALGVQSAAVLRFGVSGLSTTYLTGTLTQFVAGMTRHGAGLQARSGLILLALIGGAGLGALAALHAPLLAPLVPLGALGGVVAGAWFSFHRPAGRSADGQT